jgi:hypothetical protein
MAAKPKKKTMSDTHKAALAAGRAQGKAIGNYLDAVAAHKPKRGRKRTPESVRKQMAATDAALTDAVGTARVELVQRRRDLEVELAALGASTDLTQLEAEFVKYAKDYAQRKGISRAAFREVGVPADVLTKAGITR